MTAGEPRVTPGGTSSGLESEQQNSSTHNPVAVRAPSTMADIPIPRQKGQDRAAPTPVMILHKTFRILKLQRLSFCMGFLHSKVQQSNNMPGMNTGGRGGGGEQNSLKHFSSISVSALTLLSYSLLEIMCTRYNSLSSYVMLKEYWSISTL